jgi:hypothetical protein
MLRRLAVARTVVSEERIASINRVTRIGKLGTKLALTSNRRTLRKTLTANIRDNGGETALRNVGSYKAHVA